MKSQKLWSCCMWSFVVAGIFLVFLMMTFKAHNQYTTDLLSQVEPNKPKPIGNSSKVFALLTNTMMPQARNRRATLVRKLNRSAIQLDHFEKTAVCMRKTNELLQKYKPEPVQKTLDSKKTKEPGQIEISADSRNFKGVLGVVR